MELNAIIIDDESAARSFLSSLITEFIDNVTIVATADSAKEGEQLLKKHKVDLIFLDVEMPGGNGFDFLNMIDATQYKLVFTTAHKHFAFDAFRVKADGYLLKPIDLEDLEEVIGRIRTELGQHSNQSNASRIAFKTQESINYVDPSDIIHVKGDGNYCTVHIQDQPRLVISKNLKQLEEVLNQPYFIKPHKSHLVNVNFISRFIKSDGGSFEMADGSNVPVARRKKEEILSQLDSFKG